MLVLGSLNMNKPKNQAFADILNNVVTIKIFLISTINVVISSFGIEHVVQEEARYAKIAQLKQTDPILANMTSGKVSFDDTRI